MAAHLAEALARADPWVVNTLLTAAEREQQRGSPETAVSLLTRALAEPPPADRRFDVSLALAQAQVQTRHPEAVTSARRALALATEPSEEAQARLRLVRSLGLMGDFRSALDLLLEPTTVGDGLDPDLALQVEAEVLGVARLDADSHDEALARLDALAPRASPPRRESVVLLANLALSALERNEPPATVGQLAQRALSQGWLIEEESFQLVYAVTALIWIDWLEEADRACDAALEAAGRSGSLSLSSLAHALRSQLNLRRGRVSDAESDARIHYELSIGDAPSNRTPYGRAHLANALLERGELDEAGRVLADLSPIELAGDNPYYLDSRGRYCLRRGDVAAGLENLRACGEALARRGGVDTPTMFPWRSQAALALAQLGDKPRAHQLAAEELDLATKGQVAGAIGEALIALALIEGGDDGVRRLHSALEALATSPRVLIRIRAMTELGAMLRRNGVPRESRGFLRSALDLAHHHGALALAERAREELILAGGRPRRAASTGHDALTPSERRVAQLVGRDLTNRQIANTLFVSPRTVATHLTHIYQKLGKRDRAELRAFLADPLESD